MVLSMLWQVVAKDGPATLGDIGGLRGLQRGHKADLTGKRCERGAAGCAARAPSGTTRLAFLQGLQEQELHPTEFMCQLLLLPVFHEARGCWKASGSAGL